MVVQATYWIFFRVGEYARAVRDNNLLRRFPPNTNALVVIDVAGVHSIPLAVREGWKNKHEAA